MAIVLFRGGPATPDQSLYRFTPFSFQAGGQVSAVWSPDGKAVAFAARRRLFDPYQVHIRYLDRPTAVQLTRLSDSGFPLRWSPDSKRVLLMTTGNAPRILSLAAVGGEPEPLMTLPTNLTEPLDAERVTISPDATVVAAVVQPLEGELQVSFSSPPGSPARKYDPAPFATRDVRNAPALRFSPDGKHLLLLLNAAGRGEEAWLLQYPPNGASGVRRVLPNLRMFGGSPSVEWMPDGRHVMLSLRSTGESQLWLADIDSGSSQQLTSGSTRRSIENVAPDGDRLLFSELTGNYDVVSVDLTTAAAEALIARDCNELMPSAAAADQAIVYVSECNGSSEIWFHRGDEDRPIVAARDFPGERTLFFMAPALSPRADRVIYLRIEGRRSPGLWISSVNGGTPIQLTNDTIGKLPGAWSPDGAWFVFPRTEDGRLSLMKVKTTGQASAILLKPERSDGGVPTWSPTGEWILYGTELISPDGKVTREIGDHHSPHYVFSHDSKLLYGMRQEGERQLLFSIDLATGRERIIGEVRPALPPASNLTPSIRFSLSPDGKRVIYGSGTFKSNLWILAGFKPRRTSFFELSSVRDMLSLGTRD